MSAIEGRDHAWHGLAPDRLYEGTNPNDNASVRNTEKWRKKKSSKAENSTGKQKKIANHVSEAEFARLQNELVKLKDWVRTEVLNAPNELLQCSNFARISWASRGNRFIGW